MDDVGSNRSFQLVNVSIKIALFLIKKEPKKEEFDKKFLKHKDKPTAQLNGKKNSKIRNKENIRRQLFGDNYE
jgi:hypothetical protein